MKQLFYIPLVEFVLLIWIVNEKDATEMIKKKSLLPHLIITFHFASKVTKKNKTMCNVCSVLLCAVSCNTISCVPQFCFFKYLILTYCYIYLTASKMSNSAQNISRSTARAGEHLFLEQWLRGILWFTFTYLN